MDKNSLISSIMLAFENGIGTAQKNIMLVKYYDTFVVPKDSVDKFKMKRNSRVIHHSFSQREMQNVAEPFLDVIRDIYNENYKGKMSVQDFVKNAGVYSLQQESFASYIETGIVKRHEDPIIAEVSYEMRRFDQSVISVLDYIANSLNLIFIFDNIHYANYATLFIIKRLIQIDTACRISVMASYNENFPPENEARQAWDEIISNANADNMIYDSGIQNETSKSPIIKEEFIPDSSKAKEYVDKLANMVSMLSTFQADYYFTRLMQEIDKENIYFDYENRKRLLVIYSLNCLYRKNAGQALLVCEQLMPMLSEKDYRSKYEYYYISAIAQSLMMQSGLAQKHVTQCKKLADKIGDPNLIFKAKVLFYLVTYYSWVNIFFCDFTSSFDPSIIDEFEANGYYNTMNYVMVFAFENDAKTLKDIVTGKEKSKYFDRAIKLGTQLDNKDFLLSAYMKNIVVCTELGYHKYVEELYKKRIVIVKQEHIRYREGHMYNGMGYNCIVDEQYVQAHNYLNEALKINYEVGDTEKCAETLYNMSINCLCANEYSLCEKLSKMVIKMTECLGMNSLNLCNNAKLFGMIALCEFYLGSYYSCYIYMDKIELLTKHLLEPVGAPDYSKWDDDLFFYFLVKGLVYRNEKAHDKAKEAFERADYHQNRTAGLQFYSVTKLALERADLLNEMGYEKEAKKILTDAIDYCNEKGFFYKTRMLVKKLENNKESVAKWSLSELSISSDQLMKLASETQTKRELKNKNRDIGFLTTWQEMLNSSNPTVDKLINSSMMTLLNSYNLDGIIHIDVRDTQPRVYLTDNHMKLNQKMLNVLIKYFENNSAAFVINRGEKSFFEYKLFIELLKIDKVATVIAIPLYSNEKLECFQIAYVNMHRNFTANKRVYGIEDLTILKFAYIQLRDAIDRTKIRIELEKVNETLSRNAITDILTGVYNRQGLQRICEQAKEKAGDKKSKNSIMYMDFDNFKYYNDTFGHQIGDEILKDFAVRGEQLLANKGYVVRLGGDEFAIVLPAKTNKAAEKLARVFIEMFDEINNTIRQLIPENSYIPQEKKLSCSIGISEFSSWDEECVYDAINRADEALYFIKRTTKNDYMLWKEIPKH